MRMAGDHDVYPGRRRIDSQVVDVVKDIDRPTAYPDRFRLRKIFRPRSDIDVPPDRDQRCNPAEFVDDLRATDVTGMDDMVSRCSTSGRSRPCVSEMTPILSKIGGPEPFSQDCRLTIVGLESGR